MAQVEIADEATLEAWLKGRPRGDAEVIAFRAAARVFPLWGRAMEEEWIDETQQQYGFRPTSLVFFRLVITLAGKTSEMDTLQKSNTNPM